MRNVKIAAKIKTLWMKDTQLKRMKEALVSWKMLLRNSSRTHKKEEKDKKQETRDVNNALRVSRTQQIDTTKEKPLFKRMVTNF